MYESLFLNNFNIKTDKYKQIKYFHKIHYLISNLLKYIISKICVLIKLNIQIIKIKKIYRYRKLDIFNNSMKLLYFINNFINSH